MLQKSITATLILFVIGITCVLAQPREDAPPPQPKVEYRVMSLWQLFQGDADAERKVRQIAIKVRSDGKPRVQRTDMDVRDYEKALNRISKDGWELVTVNKSNYWVFKRVQ